MNAETNRPLRVLHLFSNCKWTGPAEPALNLCVALRARGVATDFACAPDAGDSINKVVETARERGIEPISSMHLLKHRRPWKNFVDGRRLSRLLSDSPYDLIHCHLDNDQQIALGPAKKHDIPLIRSNYQHGFPQDRRHARLVAATDFIIEASEAGRETDIDYFDVPRENTAVVPGAVDVGRFDSERDLPDGRARVGIPPEAFVLGIVARMQTHRHYGDLFEAFHRLLQEVPNAHLIVVGRGTNQEKVAFKPVQELGLQERVHFTGFIDGENYVGMLKAFDAGVYLVPGSDGTCRAVREIMAMGKPMVAADRGMLREIVQDGENGFICDGSVAGLFDAFHALATNAEGCADMAKAARHRAETAYSLEAQSAAVHDIYQRILKNRVHG
jgi:glycosyltransferase involved in cell wall biosynthesis